MRFPLGRLPMLQHPRLHRHLFLPTGICIMLFASPAPAAAPAAAPAPAPAAQGSQELARGDAAMQSADYPRALAEYQKAADQSNAIAMRHMGSLYDAAKGPRPGIQQDDRNAL